MNARHFVGTAILVLVLSPTLLQAQILTRATPDLRPGGLSLDIDCRIIVRIANNGPGLVPDAGYSDSFVQMTVGSAPWGNMALGTADPSRLTQPSGGMVAFPWLSSLALPPGTHAVTVVVDGNKAILENNETNNSQSATLTCNEPLPDLQPVDLTLDANCRIDVAFRNNGPGEVPVSGYSVYQGGNLRMYIDGAPFFGGVYLGHADPSRLSHPVGGTAVYKWYALPFGSHTVRVDMDTYNKIPEASEGNNSFEKVLSCQQPLPDLAVTDIALHQTGPFINSPCTVHITMQNIGNAAVPDVAYGHSSGVVVQMYKNGAGFGGTHLVSVDQSKVLQPAGSTFTFRWMGPNSNTTVDPGEYTLRLDFDDNNLLAELNDANNSLTKTVRCGIQILPPLP